MTNHQAELTLPQPRSLGDVLADVIDEVNAGAVAGDAATEPLPHDLMREAGLRVRQSGLTGQWGSVLRQIGYLSDDAAFPLLLDYRLAVSSLIDRHRHDRLDPLIAAQLSRGDKLASFAYSEGNDPFSFATTASRTASGYRVTGRKVPVAGGMTSDVFVTFAAGPGDDLVALLIGAGQDGVEIEPFPCTGLRTLGLAALTLNEVDVPAAYVLCERDGLGLAQELLEGRRLTLPCWVVGRMQALLEACVVAVSTTERYGQSLADLQTVEATIGRMQVATEIAQAVVDRALASAEPGRRAVWTSPSTVAKYAVIEQAQLVARLAQSVVGGRGVFAGSVFERSMRDFACLTVTAGTQQTLEVDIGIDTIAAIERRQRNAARLARKGTS